MKNPEDFRLTEFLPYELTIASERTSLAFTEFYRTQYNMLRNDWRVMVHLGTFGSLSAKDIGERSGLHKTKISRAVARLSERRWVQRTKPDHDRRFEVLSLTKKGLETYSELCRYAQQHQANLTKNLTEDEIVAFRDILSKLVIEPIRIPQT